MNREHVLLLSHDEQSTSILLECYTIAGNTDALSQMVISLIDILVPSYTITEIDFAKKHPDLVAQDFMLSALFPLLQVKSIDWNLFEIKTEELLTIFFKTTNWKGYSNTDETYIFVVARDQKSNERLGMIQYIISPKFEADAVKVALCGINPSAHNRGIEELLMSTIFHVRPHVQRIFLHTRSSNDHSIMLYTSWGFIEVKGDIPYWTDLEYRSNSSERLQQTAKNIVQR